jgi:hypothetical protein
VTPTINPFSPDTGTTGDGTTNSGTVTLTGRADAGGAITVYDGSTLLASTTANSSGTWNFATAALSNGTRRFAAEADNSLPSGFPDPTTTHVPAGVTLTLVTSDVAIRHNSVSEFPNINNRRV